MDDGIDVRQCVDGTKNMWAGERLRPFPRSSSLEAVNWSLYERDMTQGLNYGQLFDATIDGYWKWESFKPFTLRPRWLELKYK